MLTSIDPSATSSSSHVPSSSQATQQQQRLLPTTLPELIYRLGKELTCAICLGIFNENPVMMPCLHIFCGLCVERMLRVGGKSDAPCPICKLRFGRRSIVTIPAIIEIAKSFERVSQVYFNMTGDHWESFAEEKTIRPATTESHGNDNNVWVDLEMISSGEIKGLRENETDLTLKLTALDAEISKRQRTSQSHKLSSMVGKEGLLKVLDIPSTPDRNLLPSNPLVTISKSRSSRFILCFSLVRDLALREDLLKFATSFGIGVKEVFDKTVTHLITPTATDNEGKQAPPVAKRSLKYLLAILHGCWIVHPEWARSSLASSPFPSSGSLRIPLAEEFFEIQGDEYFPVEGAPQRARISRNVRGESALFKGFKFYLYGAYGVPSLADIIQLVKASGGELVKKLQSQRRKPSQTPTKVIILCDPAIQTKFEQDSQIISRCQPLISIIWLLDCISAYQILDYPPYVVR